MRPRAEALDVDRIGRHGKPQRASGAAAQQVNPHEWVVIGGQGRTAATDVDPPVALTGWYAAVEPRRVLPLSLDKQDPVLGGCELSLDRERVRADRIVRGPVLSENLSAVEGNPGEPGALSRQDRGASVSADDDDVAMGRPVVVDTGGRRDGGHRIRQLKGLIGPQLPVGRTERAGLDLGRGLDAS